MGGELQEEEEEEKLVRCLKAVEEIVINGHERRMDEMEERSETAGNVLDHHFSSSESENTSATKNRGDKDEGKMRKVGYCNNQRVQMREIQQC